MKDFQIYSWVEENLIKGELPLLSIWMKSIHDKTCFQLKFIHKGINDK